MFDKKIQALEKTKKYKKMKKIAEKVSKRYKNGKLIIYEKKFTDFNEL